MDSSLWLVGAGPMARAYAAVLQAQGLTFDVIGRSRDSASVLQSHWCCCV